MEGTEAKIPKRVQQLITFVLETLNESTTDLKTEIYTRQMTPRFEDACAVPESDAYDEFA